MVGSGKDEGRMRDRGWGMRIFSFVGGGKGGYA